MSSTTRTVVVAAVLTLGSGLSVTPLALAQGEGLGQGVTWFDSIGSNPTSLFPLTNSDGEARPVTNLMFENLLSRHWDTYEWQPNLASAWEISPDGKQFTFTLDPKAKFQDGSQVTPEDVKFSFDVIFMDGVFTPSLKPYYEQIAKVEAVGKDKIRFTAKDVYYKNFESAAELTIFQKKHYMALYAKDKSLTKAEVTKKPMGSSPWLLEKWDDNQQIILKRNPNYWNKAKLAAEGRWNYDRVLFRIIPDSTVEFETFRKGDLSLLGLSPKQWTLQTGGPEFGKRIVKVQAENKTAKGYNYFAWNNSHPILGNKDVRWALAHLVDIEKWNKKLDFGLRLPTIGPFSPRMEEHEPSLKPVPFSVKDARKRLAAAGWTKAGPDGFLTKDGKRFEFTMIYPVQAKEQQEPRMADFKNQAAKVGIDVKLKAVEWTSFTKLLDDRNFDAVALAWGRALDGDAKQIWHSASIEGGGSNFISYRNAEVDRLIDEHRRTLDRPARVALARRIQKAVYEDQPYAFLDESRYSLYAHQSSWRKQRDTFNYTIGTAFWSFAK